MFVKAFMAIAAMVGAIMYFMHDGGYHREVGASPDKVRAALYSLDVRTAPGAPGTDPMNSGGVPSNFAVTQEGDDMVWTVTNGNDVAVRMIAHLEAVDGGAHTKVTARIERGNAPDDHVAPAFRSKGVTMGLFAMVLEDKLDSLVMPAAGEWSAKCDEIWSRVEQANAAAGGMEQSSSIGQAMGKTARLSMNLAAGDKELKAAGCPVKSGNQFEDVHPQLTEGAGPPAPVVDERGDGSDRPNAYAAPSTDLSKFK